MSTVLLRTLCLSAAIIYYSAFTLSFLKNTVSEKASHVLWCIGITLSGAIVINNYLANGYMPFVSMYQVLTFLAVVFAPAYLYVRYMRGGGFMKKYFIATQGVLMTGVFFMVQNSVWSFPPALQSGYFIPHVFSYMISYSLVAIAAILCIMLPFKKNQLRQYRRGIYDLVVTAFPFMTLGMLLGALWANSCWGHFWSWDLKEAWSLVTMLSLAVYLHFRRHNALGKYAEIFVILAFAFEIITLFFVGMFGGDSIHTYS
ncbi:MAG: cytochrome c biogenesis protein CcsA [Clostridia bacterium]|nr:cytochrome c biogenesis protein CcsA [Clostridia bacterium]